MNQQQFIYNILSEEHQERILNIKNKECPFHRYVGNEKAVEIAILFAKSAFKSAYIGNGIFGCDRKNSMRIRLSGPASVGKTTFARNLIKLVGTEYTTGEWLMPFAEVDGTSITKREQIIDRIKIAMEEKKLSLFPNVIGNIKHYQLPPLGLFIDEVHALPEKIKEGLLKMSELNDGIFETDTERIDCKGISIIIASTNPGKMPPALKTRFPVQIELKQHTEDEVAKIIQNETNWDFEHCKKLARLKPLPREAKSMAGFVELAKVSNGLSVDEAITYVAEKFDLLENGVSKRAMDILKILESNEAGLSKKNLCNACANMNEEEFDSEIMPQLLNKNFVSVGHRHKITDNGKKELKQRLSVIGH